MGNDKNFLFLHDLNICEDLDVKEKSSDSVYRKLVPFANG